MKYFMEKIFIVALITVTFCNVITCDIISEDNHNKFIGSDDSLILEEDPLDNMYDDESYINENYDENLNHMNRHRHKNKYNKTWYQKYGHDNFLLTDYLVDGEMERRISFNGITAKETSLGNNSKSISLWQLSDGKAFIQVIFTSEHQLIDCEYVRQRDLVKHFLTKFYREIALAKARNFTTPYNIPHHHKVHLSDHEFRQYIDNGVLTSEMDDIESNMDQVKFEDEVDTFGLRNLMYKKLQSDSDLPDDIRPWMDVRSLRVMCNKRHRQMKKLAAAISGDNESERNDAEEHLNRQKRALADWFLAPNTKWCGQGNQAEKYNHLGGYSRADACCRKHDHCKFIIKGMTTKWNLFNYRPYTMSHCSCDISKKRDLSSLLRIPGTKWCGAGWSASKYVEMGPLSRADRCCRKHDTTCPYWILGFETKYGLFNWRVGTLMHCSCDERFRTCLKMAVSADANMVGRVFFNVLQTKCFVLKPEKICKERSWWGQCTKKGIRKRAHIRDNRKF